MKRAGVVGDRLDAADGVIGGDGLAD